MLADIVSVEFACPIPMLAPALIDMEAEEPFSEMTDGGWVCAGLLMVTVIAPAAVAVCKLTAPPATSARLTAVPVTLVPEALIVCVPSGCNEAEIVIVLLACPIPMLAPALIDIEALEPLSEITEGGCDWAGADMLTVMEPAAVAVCKLTAPAATRARLTAVPVTEVPDADIVWVPAAPPAAPTIVIVERFEFRVMLAPATRLMEPDDPFRDITEGGWVCAGAEMLTVIAPAAVAVWRLAAPAATKARETAVPVTEVPLAEIVFVPFGCREAEIVTVELAWPIPILAPAERDIDPDDPFKLMTEGGWVCAGALTVTVIAPAAVAVWRLAAPPATSAHTRITAGSGSPAPCPNHSMKVSGMP